VSDGSTATHQRESRNGQIPSSCENEDDNDDEDDDDDDDDGDDDEKEYGDEIYQ
jgi:hypothetical protein